MRGSPRALLLLAVLAACGAPNAKPGGAPTLAPASPRATATAAVPRPSRLVGEWMRRDVPYLIVIDALSPEGKVAARYLNPRPINVTRAEWRQEGVWLRLLVELRDRGYPGNSYELTFDPVSDRLFGVYHHLGLNQDFDVSFSRQRP